MTREEEGPEENSDCYGHASISLYHHIIVYVNIQCLYTLQEFNCEVFYCSVHFY